MCVWISGLRWRIARSQLRSRMTWERASIRFLRVRLLAGLHQIEALLDLAEQPREIPCAPARRGTTISPAPCATGAGSVPRKALRPCGSGAGGIRGGRPRSRRVRHLPLHQRRDRAADGGFMRAGAMRRCIARCRRRCGSRASPARAIPECRARSAPDTRPRARN